MDIAERLAKIGFGYCYDVLNPPADLSISELLIEALIEGFKDHRMFSQTGGWFREYEDFVQQNKILNKILPSLLPEILALFKKMAYCSGLNYIVQAINEIGVDEELYQKSLNISAAAPRKMKNPKGMLPLLQQ